MLASACAMAMAACVTDWNQREIPHWLLGGLVLLWAVSAMLVPDALGASSCASLFCGVGVAAVGVALYAWAGLGGGDVKLLAALALWLGPWDLGLWLIGTALMGLFLILVASCRSFAGLSRPRRSLRLGHFSASGWPSSRPRGNPCR